MVEAKEVTIKLESWQTRQLANYLPSQKVQGLVATNINRIVVRPGIGGCLSSYKVISKITDGFEIYLTDAQIESVKKYLGPAAEVVSVTISAEAIQNEAVALMR